MLVFVWYALLYIHSSFTIILTRKRELVALLLLSFGSLVTVNVLWLFLTVPWVGLQWVIVVFPDHTHLPFDTVSYQHCVSYWPTSPFLCFIAKRLQSWKIV